MIAGALALWWSPPAEAALLKLCADILTDFTDAYPDHAAVYDDYFNDNTVQRPMRGVYWAVEDVGTGIDDTGYALDAGTDAGCKTFFVTPGVTYRIKMHSRSKVGANHEIKVMNQPGQGVTVKVWNAAWVAPSTGTTIKVVQNGGKVWSLLSAVSWALFHRDGGLSNEQWRVYNTTCPGGGFCMSCDPDQDAVLSSDCAGGTDSDPAAIFAGSMSRYLIAHELGHYLLRKRNEGGGSNNDPSVATGGCNFSSSDTIGHEYQSKEFVSEAYHEGFASFYAAVAFNKSMESDCFVHYYKDQNYDLDEDIDGEIQFLLNKPKTVVNCAGNPEQWANGSWMDFMDPLEPAVSAEDYLTDCVVGLNKPGALANRATELDFVRFWFDLYQRPNWTFTDIVDVLDAVDAHVYFIGDSDIDPNPNDAVKLPAQRIFDTLNAAPFNGTYLETDWLNQQILHGVWR